MRSQQQLDQAVERGIAEFGKIDILTANAGIWTQAPFWELTDDQWDEMIGVNLTGVWKSAKAMRRKIERGSGSMNKPRRRRDATRSARDQTPMTDPRAPGTCSPGIRAGPRRT